MESTAEVLSIGFLKIALFNILDNFPGDYVAIAFQTKLQVSNLSVVTLMKRYLHRKNIELTYNAKNSLYNVKSNAYI